MLPPAWWGYGPLLSAGSPASMGRPSGIEPDLPGPRPGVLPLPLRPPWSTRRGSNPQPSACDAAARPIELLVGLRRAPWSRTKLSPRIRRVPSPSGSCPSCGTGWTCTTVSWVSTRRLRCLSYGPSMERDVGTAPTPAGWKPAVHLSTPVPLGDASRSRTESDVVCSHVPCRPAHASSLRRRASNPQPPG